MKSSGASIYHLIDPKTKEVIAASNGWYFVEQFRKLWQIWGRSYKVIRAEATPNELNRFTSGEAKNSGCGKFPPVREHSHSGRA
jgi:hypothetical protein